jgi:hypothetical protein
LTPHEKRERLIAHIEELLKAVDTVRSDVRDLEGKSAEMATLRSARIEDLDQLHNDVESWLVTQREVHRFLTCHELEKKN